MKFSKVHPAFAPNRLSWQLAEGWKFKLDPACVGESVHFADGLESMKKISVPFRWETTFHDLMPYGSLADWWLEKEFFIPEFLMGRQVNIHFENLNQDVSVYINGIKTADHYGSSRHFILPVDQVIFYGQTNRISLRFHLQKDSPKGSALYYMAEDPTPVEFQWNDHFKGLEGRIWISTADYNGIEDVSLSWDGREIFYKVVVPKNCQVQVSLQTKDDKNLFSSNETSGRILLTSQMPGHGSMKAVFEALVLDGNQITDRYRREIEIMEIPSYPNQAQ